MNTPSDAIPESSLASHRVEPAAVPWTQLFYWCVRRELWEFRSIYIAPLGVAGLILVGSLISLVQLPHNTRAALALDPVRQRDAIGRHYDVAALLIMGVTLIVALYYCLEAFHGERRDRAILFWKSLPVSDFTVVLSKAAIPLVILPLVTFAVTVVTQGIMLFLNAAVLLASGIGVAPLWNNLSPFHMSWMLLYHLLALHGFWYAPIYGWLLFVSAWARRAPLLWATAPLLAVGFVEKIAFNTSYFGAMLMHRFAGSPQDASSTPGSMSMDALTHTGPLALLSSPGFWIGLAVTAAFLFAAVRLRRNQGPA